MMLIYNICNEFSKNKKKQNNRNENKNKTVKKILKNAKNK